MKLSLFVHMERTLPEESQEKLYQEMIELCEIADRGGMHAIWTGEHHGMNFTIAPNPFINLADIARRTSRVRLGTGTIIAPFNHPIRLAGEAAMTDIITGGRLELGIARGAYSYEYERLMPGLTAWDAGQRMRELIPAVKNCGRATMPIRGILVVPGDHLFAAAETAAASADLGSGARSQQSRICGAKRLQRSGYAAASGEEEIVRLVTCFNEARARFAAEQPLKIMLLQHGYVAEDEADARLAAEELNRFYHYFGAWFKNQRPVQKG